MASGKKASSFLQYLLCDWFLHIIDKYQEILISIYIHLDKFKN